MKVLNILMAAALVLASAVLLSTGAAARGVESHNITFNVAYGAVVVAEDIAFESPLSRELVLDIPSNTKGLSVKVDRSNSAYETEDSKLMINLSSAKRVRFSYVTPDFLDGTDFTASFRAQYNISELRIKLVLPENAVLAKPLSESRVGHGSVYPKPSSALTDGRSIILIWDYGSVDKGEEKSFFVRYKRQASSFYITVLGVLIAALILGIGAYFGMAVYRSRKRAKRAYEEPQEKAEEPGKGPEEEGSFGKHLKEDEEQVVNLLKQREGKCEQGTLRIITGFSKAKLSGLLKELEDRKIVHREKRGKKNLVFLKEQ